jgi:hypothetical protein
MKTTILAFLLGIAVTISLAANTKSFMTFKPAQPISIVAYKGEQPHTFTSKYANRGYQVSATASCGYYYTYVVMVKY